MMASTRQLSQRIFSTLKNAAFANGQINVSYSSLRWLTFTTACAAYTGWDGLEYYKGELRKADQTLEQVDQPLEQVNQTLEQVDQFIFLRFQEKDATEVLLTNELII